MFGSSGKRLVGLDIGTSSIKAVLLKHSSKGYALENLGIEPLPPEVIVDRSILDATVVVDALTKLFSRTRLNTRVDIRRWKQSGWQAHCCQISCPITPRARRLPIMGGHSPTMSSIRS